MTEAADPGIEARQSDAGPAAEVSEMGMGFAEDTQAGDLPSKDGYSEAPTDTPPAADAAAESQPGPNAADGREGGMRRDDYDRKLGEHARDKEAFRAEQDRWYSQRQKDAHTPAPPAQTATETAAFSPDLATQIAQQAGLDADATAGLHALQQLNSGQFDAMRTELSELRGIVERTGQTTTQLTEHQNNALRSEISTQRKEADGLYGPGSVETHREAVGALLNTRNPTTTEYYTIVEAGGMLTGKSPEEARQARQSNQSARTNARRSATVQGSHVAPGSNGSDRISTAQAMAEIDATM